MTTYRVMVTGSRGWDNEDAVYVALERLLSRYPRGFELMHGGAEGADLIASWWALDHGEVVGRTFRPDYKKYGKRAPHVRNDAMLDRADFVLAFWDGKSRGTKSVIDKTLKRGLSYEVHRQEQEFSGGKSRPSEGSGDGAE